MSDTEFQDIADEGEDVELNSEDDDDEYITPNKVRQLVFAEILKHKPNFHFRFWRTSRSLGSTKSKLQTFCNIKKRWSI